jgi:AraC-like DNA-binding protein
MESVVPIFGHEILDRNRPLKDRIRSIVEDDFGHIAKFTDAGSVGELHHADPLRTVIPFTVLIKGGLDDILINDFLVPLFLGFPKSKHIEAAADHIPAMLKQSAEELSLGHVNGGPVEIRRSMKVIYKHLSKANFNLLFLAQAIGVSKSTLERAFKNWANVGAGRVIHKVKLSEAHRIALTTSIRVEAISFAVGYENLSSFDRAFSREFGASVTSLRQNVNPLRQTAKQMSHSA